MAGDGSIFRPEAVAHSERQSRPGDVLRAAPRWTSWFFYLLLALVLLALLAASLLEIDRYVRGPTASEDGRVIVFLPAAVAPSVSRGSLVEIGDLTTEVVSSSEIVLDPAEIERRYSVEVVSPSVAVRTSATGPATGGLARVLVESDPVIIQFVPGLDRLFGGDGA